MQLKIEQTTLVEGVLPETLWQLPSRQQAATLLELLTIRAFHSKMLHRFSLGTRPWAIRSGVEFWPIFLLSLFLLLRRSTINSLATFSVYQLLLRVLKGIWRDVDVVEFSYCGAPAPAPKEEIYNELVDGLGGSNSCIGHGSQVANQETYGTLGAIVKSRTGSRPV